MAKPSVTEMLDVLELLVEPGSCEQHLDHHGNCQFHGSLMPPEECPHARGQVILAAYGRTT